MHAVGRIAGQLSDVVEILMNGKRLAVVAGCAGVLCIGSMVFAMQARDAKAATADDRLQACAWLAGEWVELDEGGRTEERWTPPSANSMVGTCRMIRNGKVGMYEFMLIEQTGDDVELRIRHYRWNMADIDKEPLVWKLVKSGEKELIFENPSRERVRRIEYRRDGDVSLSCTLVSVKDGQDSTQVFEFKKTAREQP
jgi:hypothetical protein